VTEAIVKQEQHGVGLAPGDWHAMREAAGALVKSGFMPKAIDTPEKAIAVAMAGRELGIPMMQAIRSIHIIDGKPTISADLMAALVHKRMPGARLRVTQSTNEVCSVEAGRAGEDVTVFSFTIKDATTAGLTTKDVWKKYPRAMLRARCISEAVRAVFPDAFVGVYTPEEFDGGGFEQVGNPDRVTPHAMLGEDANGRGDRTVYEMLSGWLTGLEQGIASCDTYDRVLELRTELGSPAKQTELLKKMQEARESGQLGPADGKELGKLWQRCHRQLSKLEESLKPDVVESFVDATLAEPEVA